MLQAALLLTAAVAMVTGDVYMHNPRGSNNRLDGLGREVSNNQRLFDSQNNNRGGYLQGNMYYYDGSVLDIEWTNQHSCSDPNNNCELIIQYMCGEHVRDGKIRNKIGEYCRLGKCDPQRNFGLHENHLDYLKCRSRSRNKGLFTADQKLKGEDARYTRQNANGQRRGLECPEERDYYPYWHPTPWRDIAVLTSDVSRCAYYKKESENRKGRGECIVYDPKADNEDDVFYNFAFHSKFKVPNNKADCEKFEFVVHGNLKYPAKWVERPAHKIRAPTCKKAPWSRDNHLGNGMGKQHNRFRWRIPALEDNCIIRIRYNISTNEFDTWKTDSKSNGAGTINVATLHGLSKNARGYEFKNNPTVDIFNGVKLNLAINTAQFGRTFQDRSHVFTVKKRSENGLTGKAIHNVNVRGKRGNIVQAYPSTEYDFVPDMLAVSKGHYVHFQWTGSDNNPRNNAGQGKAGSDRSNVIRMGPEVYKEGSSFNWYRNKKRIGDLGRNYPELLFQDFLGFSYNDKCMLAGNLDPTKGIKGGNLLDDAKPYFDLGPRQVNAQGTVYRYMSTRNNAFTNRAQKATIIVN